MVKTGKADSSVKSASKGASAKKAAKAPAKKQATQKIAVKKAAAKPARKAKPVKAAGKAVPVVAGQKEAKQKAAGDGVTLSEGLEYPWGKAKRLWNILWVLVPVAGILALIGYESKIVQAIVGGNKKELPAFGKFGGNLKIGFFLFLKAIPLFAILWLIRQIPHAGKLLYCLLMVLYVPYLVVHLLHTNRIDAVFEVNKASKAVFGNFLSYILALLKTIVYVVLYLVLSFVLVGIPCLEFGEYIYMADFYAKTSVEKK